MRRPDVLVPRPGLDEVRAWLDVAEIDLSDDQLALIYATEASLQADFCRWWGRRGPWPDTNRDPDDLVRAGGMIPAMLAQAFLYRCARNAASRGLPLGTLPVPMTGAGGEYGAALLPRLHPEIERLEAPYRVIAVA